MAHSVTSQAESDLDEIWAFVALESGSLDIADSVIDAITRRFLLLSRNPYIGRSRDEDLRVGLRSFPVGKFVILYSVENERVRVLRVFHGSRDIDALLGFDTL